MVRQQASLLLVCSLLAGCAYFRPPSVQPDRSGYDIEQLKRELPPLSLTPPFTPTDEVVNYFAYYDLNPTNAQHFFGMVESEGHALAMHVFIPEEPKGTLFLLHGYFDHTGTLSKLIAEGLSRHYAVVTWDLPGHGLSTGDRTDTGEFDLCARQFIDVVKRAEPIMPPPFHLIAHSTGCSVAIEYMYHVPENTFDEMVFLAPLVRHKHWHWARFGYAIANPFKDRVRRRDKQNSSDQDYLAFAKGDPLQSSDLSFEYLEDLYQWEKRFKNYPVRPDSILIIQGDRDSIVDWKYNMKFLNGKFQDAQIHMIPGARHQLVNERKELRDQVFSLIFRYFNSAIQTPSE